MEKKVVCFSCQHELSFEGSVGRQDVCPECQAYVHCCRNCRFYDPSVYNECSEPMAERVVDKEQANYCDYFEPSSSKTAAAGKEGSAKQGLEDLFKKG